MANKLINDKGFLIIEMTFDEAKRICHFGCCDYIYCDYCNKNLNKDNCDKIYFIATLAYAVCKSCCDDFIKKQLITKKMLNMKLTNIIILLDFLILN